MIKLLVSDGSKRILSRLVAWFLGLPGLAGVERAQDFPASWEQSCSRWCRAGVAGAVFAVTASAGAQTTEIRIGGTGAALGAMDLLAQAYARSRPDIELRVLPSMGSGGGIKALLAGAIQIAVSARPLSEAESKAGAVAVAYGRTPFVFAVATQNGVNGITSRNLIDFYSGTVNTWPDGTTLRLVLRPIGDAASEIIKNISPAMRAAKTAAEQRKGMVFAITDQEAARAIETIPGAMGPSTLALLLSEKHELKALALDGVVPSAQTLANGSYPLFMELLLVTGPKSPPAAKAFVTFVRSAAGQEILRQTGHWVNWPGIGQ